jgi:UDP-N-acetylglucosamine acyltransferase
MSSVTIHPSAVVASSAELGKGVSIGAYAVIGEGVVLGDRTSVGNHATVEGPAIFGEDNRIFPHAALGFEPQDLKYRGEPTRLVVGARNVFREFSTVQRGTATGGGETIVGDDNYFMNYTHVAHDNRIGSHVVMANCSVLAGHVQVGNHAKIGAFNAVHQFCRVGAHAFMGAYSACRQDVLPFCRTEGMEDPRTFGINTIGLKRAGFSDERVEALQKAYRLLRKSKLNTSQALERIMEELPNQPDVEELVTFIRTSERGFIK